MKSFARKPNQRIINITLVAAALFVSSLTAVVPFLFGETANAAPGVAYTTPAESALDWSPDRTAPSGGWSVNSGTGAITLNIDQTHANTSATFYQTEGIGKALPAGTDSIKGSVYIPSSWNSKPNLRVGLWGVTQDAGLTGPSYPIIEYAANVGGYTGWRVWNANTGIWNNLPSITTTYDGQNSVEIVSNYNTGNFDFYVNDNFVYTYSAEGYTTFTNMILNNYNVGSNLATDNYTVVWNGLQDGSIIPNYQDVYVSPTGNDADHGTSPLTAFKTIQKAINTVAAGGNVHIADGTYSEKLSFTQGDMNLIGESEAGVVIQPLSNEYGQGLTSEGFSNISISNVTVQANAATSGGSAIKFHNASNISLTNVAVTGTGNLRGIDINGVDGVQLTNVNVNGFGKNGIAFTAQYAPTDSFTTQSVTLTDVSSTNNGWAGIAFYTVGGGSSTADISNVVFAGTTTISGNGQAGIFFEGGTDAGFGAHTTPTGSITGASNGDVSLAGVVFSSNGFNIVNYQLKDVDASSATINGVEGNSMTDVQRTAAEATIIDHDDFANYGDVFLVTPVPPVVTPPADTTPTPTTTPTVTPVITPIITPASAVLGDTTTNDGSTTGNTGVEGATDDKTATATQVNSDANQGKIFGIAWYWWILIIAALAAVAWFITAAIRRRNDGQS